MQVKQNPLVSIIIPTYNRAELIKDTLRLVEAQTYKNWEYIVVDDGSSDGMQDVIIDEKTGLLVKKHDVDGMAEQIIKIIEDPDLAKRLGYFGKENIKQNFSMQKHLEILKSTLTEASSDIV